MEKKSSSGTAKQPDGVATTSGHGGSVISVNREEFVHTRTVIVAADRRGSGLNWVSGGKDCSSSSRSPRSGRTFCGGGDGGNGGDPLSFVEPPTPSGGDPLSFVEPPTTLPSIALPSAFS